MSNRNSQTINSNPSGSTLTPVVTPASNQVAIAPALVIAGILAREAVKAAARIAIQYGKQYVPTAISGFTAGGAVGYAGVDPQDVATVNLAKIAAWKLYQKAQPVRAALPGAQAVFDQSFSAGMQAGKLLRSTHANNNVTPRDTAVALKNTEAGKAGSDGFVIGTAVSANTNQNAQKQVPNVKVA
jgi:hypothetical protein